MKGKEGGGVANEGTVAVDMKKKKEVDGGGGGGGFGGLEVGFSKTC